MQQISQIMDPSDVADRRGWNTRLEHAGRKMASQPRAPFRISQAENSSAVKGEAPDAKPAAVLKLLAARWKELDAPTKRIYVRNAASFAAAAAAASSLQVCACAGRAAAGGPRS